MNLPRTSWKIRRRVMFSVLAFCMIIVTWVIASGIDTRAADTAVSMSFSIIGLVVTAYVFGATVENIQRWKLSNAGSEQVSSG